MHFVDISESSVCEVENKSQIHVFMECQHVRELWTEFEHSITIFFHILFNLTITLFCFAWSV